MFCKTIILSNTNNLYNNAPKGILTLTKESHIIKGKIRLYNLNSLHKDVKVGIYINDKVYTSHLTQSTNCYNFELTENIDINDSIYCALIDTANNKQVLLEGGSFNGFCFTDSPIDAVLEAKDEQLEQTIDEVIKQSNECPTCDCENCEYKKYFYQKQHTPQPLIEQDLNICDKSNLDNNDIYNNNSNIYNDTNNGCNNIDTIQQEVISNLENELDDDIKNITYLKNQTNNEDILNNDMSTDDEKLNFLNDIIYQLDELLAKHPADELLNSIIPNSRFVKVDGDKPYVIGVIYEDKMLKYIAYGVPAIYNALPPADLGQHYQWLPLNPRDVMSDGYFMIYQDAINGTIVEINFE